MQLSHARVILALAIALPTFIVRADDASIIPDRILDEASKEIPIAGHSHDHSEAVEDMCEYSGVVGYLYCRGADWTAWFFSTSSRHASHPLASSLPSNTRSDAQRRLQWGSASGMRFATRSFMPMHKYLRQVELKDSKRTGAAVATKSQVNSVKYNGKAPKIANPVYSVVPEKYADHRVKHVNGLKNPVVKCANLAPNDPRKCVKSTGGRGGLRRKNYEKLP